MNVTTPITLNYCNYCSMQEVSMKPPFKVSLDSKAMPFFTMVAGVPKVYKEDIVEQIKELGYSDGKFIFQIDLSTKKIINLTELDVKHSCNSKPQIFFN